MKLRDKKYIAVVNGNVVYKWATDINDLKNLLRREALANTGRFNLTDYKCVERKEQRITG